MNKIAEIIRRINRVLDIEEDITRREREKYAEKMEDEKSYWGLGGNYRRYEKCVEARDEHLKELKALREQSTAGLQVTEELRLYPFYCPSCSMTVYLGSAQCRHMGGDDIIDCPICQRTLYRSAKNVSWKIIAGSKYFDKR